MKGAREVHAPIELASSRTDCSLCYHLFLHPISLRAVYT